MKRIAPLVALLFLTACASLYTVTISITDVRDRLMKDWAAASASGHSTAAIDANVVKADAVYRAAATTALRALQAYKANGDQASYLAALQAVRAAVGTLLDVVAPILSPTEAQTLTSNLSKASKL